MSDASTNSESGGSMSTTKRIQFGRAPASSSSSSSTDSSKKSIQSEPSEPEDYENVNLRLRHREVEQVQQVEAQYLEDVLALVTVAVLQESIHEVVILRESNSMSTYEVNIDYVPLTEKQGNAEYEIDLIMNSDEEFLVYRKFKKDISWLEKVLRTIVEDLERSYCFDDFLLILNDEKLNSEEEKMLLSSKEFNRREVIKLREFIDQEKQDLTRQIQRLTEEIGNIKDQLNDNVAEDYVKVKYMMHWQQARMEQNSLILEQNEEQYRKTSRQMNVELQKENRIHEEMWSYLDLSLSEYKTSIEQWMEKYDTAIDEKDNQLQEIKLKLENQKEKHTLLRTEYSERQQKMEAYKEHKRQKQIEALELRVRNRAASKIQSWWRGVMFRKHLGPFRKKKGKKQKGSGKNSAKKKK